MQDPGAATPTERHHAGDSAEGHGGEGTSRPAGGEEEMEGQQACSSGHSQDEYGQTRCSYIRVIYTGTRCCVVIATNRSIFFIV